MTRLLRAAAAGLCLLGGVALSASGQMTTPTAPAGSLTIGGVAIGTGTIAFTAVNTSMGSTPVGLTVGGKYFAPAAITCTITNGGISTSPACSVPDLSQAIPTSANAVLAYNIRISNASSNYELQNVTGVQGATWALNSYAPTQVAVVSLSGLVTGTTPPSSCHGASKFYTQTNPVANYDCVGNVYVLEVSSGSAGVSIAWKGVWSGTTTYALNDAVSYNGSSYISTGANNTNNTPSNSSSSWGVLAAQGATGQTGAAGTPGTPGSNGLSITWKGPYAAGTTYAVNDAVSLNGSSYISIAASNVGHSPDTSTSFWNPLAVKGADGAPGGGGASLSTPTVYSSAATYAAGALVKYTDGLNYLSLASSNVGNTPGSSPSNWAAFSDASGTSAAETARASAAEVALGNNTIQGKKLSSNPVLTLTDIGATAAPIAGGAFWYSATVGTSPTGTEGYLTYQVPAAAYEVQFLMGNAWGASETCGPNMTINMALEAPNDSTPIPLTLNGQQNMVIAPCGYFYTDPVSIDIPASNPNVTLRIMTTKTNPSDGVAIPYNWGTGGIPAGGFGSYTTTKSSWDGGQVLTARTLTDVVTTAASVNISSATGFTGNDKGMTIVLTGAGASGANLTTTIATVTGPNTATLATAASSSLTSVNSVLTQTNYVYSGAMPAQGGANQLYVPMGMFGHLTGTPKSAGVICDSRCYGTGADPKFGSWTMQALNSAGLAAGLDTVVSVGIPFENMSMPGDTAANYASETGARMRKLVLKQMKHSIGALGINDLFGNGQTDLQVEQYMVNFSTQLANRGVQITWGTVEPETTSTDGWLTTSGQTVRLTAQAGNYRTAYNDWLRDGAPMTCPAKSGQPGVIAAKGATGASIVRAPYYVNGAVSVAGSGTACAHPMAQLFELADTVESSRNSGLWAVDPNVRTLTGCSMTSGSTTLTCSGGTFTAADAKVYVSVAGAGAGGANLLTFINNFTNSTTVILSGAAGTTISGGSVLVDGGQTGAANVFSNTGGRLTGDGIHGSSRGHYLMGQAGALQVATWTF